MTFEIREVEETYRVRGEQIKVTAPAKFDSDTQQQVFDEKLDDAAINQALDIYRRDNQMITVERIKQLRQRLGLSQRDFAALLSWSPTTVATYETGALPSLANNSRLLALENNPLLANELLAHTSRPLSKSGRLALQQHLADHATVDARQLLTSGVALLFKSVAYTADAGYVAFDQEKFTNMVLFFAKKLPRLTPAILNQLLFYTDFTHFWRNTVAVSGVAYVRSAAGPIPDNYGLLYGVMVATGQLKAREVSIDGGIQTHLVAQKNSDLTVFTASEQTALQETVRYFAKLNTHQILELAQTEASQLSMQVGQRISYELADKLVSPEQADWASLDD